MKTTPAEKQEGLFPGTLAQDCGQRSREEPVPDFVQGGHRSVVSMGDFVFEQDTLRVAREGGAGSRKERTIMAAA
jgi:hypothetical protein